MKRVFFVTFMVVSCLASCEKKPGRVLHFIGIDEDGKETVQPVAGDAYASELGDALSIMARETRAAAEKVQARQPWSLQQIDVGLGITAAVKFFVVGAEFTPSVLLEFKKS